MAKNWNLSECFQKFGATGANSRWSWSARSPDGAVVVLTLWKDQIEVQGKTAIYDTFGKNLDKWVDKPGNRERLENLKWARDHCDGLFRVVITTAKDVSANPRAISECYPHDMQMRLYDLNEDTGEFRATSV